jgi:hypothetical protein
VGADVNRQTARFAPILAITALGTVLPGRKFKFDAVGRVEPQG